ncbi:MAG: tRNA preQ1(34) S-adenosylmethionine ribosyltransferase-isomerase QueA [Christensenellaceae bacterium]|jgi:S-adenosylmethionine:tRNA ribosyltransferase-isomerase|nr:tRNA preQ1(34) S-adenosylmethionine ribosyltransferase-isomerase QueA [Christensenellaceae bacterium]
MNKSDFSYQLPENLIAQKPAEPRDSSRLLIYDRKTFKTEHVVFSDIKNYLRAGDVLVLNNTRVTPARLYAYDDKGRKSEILLLKRISYYVWEVIMRPTRKVKFDVFYTITEGFKFKLIEVLADGVRHIQFYFEGVFEDLLSKCGTMPLPPYIKENLEDPERYQTVYSKVEGSAAAPTAGLHFTSELLDQIRKMGVIVVEILLHVGLGTFRPVKEKDIEKHRMHSEYFEISKEVADTINLAKSGKRRVIAVGTTTTRTLESASDENGFVEAKEDSTEIFIYPPYKFKVVDALITNFHLPESSLLMLMSAFAGHNEIMEIYKQAVEMRYRFFSFGDAMFVI